MIILRHILSRAVAKLAGDPRVRAKVAELVDEEIKPRVAAAWRRTKPKLDAAGEDLRDIARERDPRRDPAGFAAKVKERFLDRDRDA